MDEHRHDENDRRVSGVEPQRPGEASGTLVGRSEVDEVLNDSSMPMEERVRRLRALSERAGVQRSDDGAVDPLLDQINEALNLLATGGHSYDAAESTLEPDQDRRPMTDPKVDRS